MVIYNIIFDLIILSQILILRLWMFLYIYFIIFTFLFGEHKLCCLHNIHFYISNRKKTNFFHPSDKMEKSCIRTGFG